MLGVGAIWRIDKMKQIELEKSSMAFKLSDGNVLLISKEDVTEIANKLIIEMMINKSNSVYMLKNNSIEKCNLLYKIVIDQKDTMSNETKENYFKAILEFLKTENDTELETLKEKIEAKSR